MAARIDKGRAQLLTRTGLDWTEKSPAAVSALANREDRLRLRRILRHRRCRIASFSDR